MSKASIMKKRVGGAIVVAAVLVGMYIGQFLKLPGLGPNETTAPQQASTTPKETSETTADVSVSVPAGQVMPAQPVIEAPELVTVVIVANGYRLTSDGHPETGLDMPLSDIVARAERTTGDQSGTRVKILLHQSAQEGARSSLYEALSQAGLKPGEIQENSEFLK